MRPAGDYTWGHLGRDAAKLAVLLGLVLPSVLIAAAGRLRRRLLAWALR